MAELKLEEKIRADIERDLVGQADLVDLDARMGSGCPTFAEALQILSGKCARNPTSSRRITDLCTQDPATGIERLNALARSLSTLRLLAYNCA